MPLFKSSDPVPLQLTPDCHQALLKLEEDTATLTELLRELLETQRFVVSQLRAEMESAAIENGSSGVEAFAEAPPEAFTGLRIEPNDTETRESPFRRAPRKVQVAWLRQVMAGGGWYSAFAIADRYATDERHRRYMRSAVGGRLREMYEDGEVDRRDSRERGAMFEYRLKAATS